MACWIGVRYVGVGAVAGFEEGQLSDLRGVGGHGLRVVAVAVLERVSDDRLVNLTRKVPLLKSAGRDPIMNSQG